MTYRDDIAALRARASALQLEVTDRGRELATTRGLLDEAERRARLPVLDNIRVAAPCTASWAAMTGDERVRACADCQKRVYNISALTRDEAQALIVEHEGKLCIRYYQRADGTILLKDCTIGVRRRRRRKLVAGAAALLASTGVAAAVRPHASAPVAPPVTVMLGQVRVSPPPAIEMLGQMVAPLHEVKGNARFHEVKGEAKLESGPTVHQVKPAKKSQL